jgi:hypothetical protein
MNSAWRRALAGLGLATAGLLLSGCHAQGTFDVLSEERVAVDLTITGANLSCPHGADELKLLVTTTTDEFGDAVCHVTGETQATYFSPFGIDITPAAEYLVLQTTLSGTRDSWPTADILVRFPGKVVDATQGEVEDNTVRIKDLGALTQGSGLRVVGARASGLPAWVQPAAAGAGAGAGLVLLIGATAWLLRRPARRGLVDPGDVDWPPLEEAIISAPADEAFDEDGSGGSGPPPQPSPGRPGVQQLGTQAPIHDSPDVRMDERPDTLGDDGPDTSWFASPPAGTRDALDGATGAGPDREPERASPRSAWARPGDH